MSFVRRIRCWLFGHRITATGALPKRKGTFWTRTATVSCGRCGQTSTHTLWALSPHAGALHYVGAVEIINEPPLTTSSRRCREGGSRVARRSIPMAKDLRWAEADALRAAAGDLPGLVLMDVPSGTRLFHGGATTWTRPRPQTWFTTTRAGAKYYAEWEAPSEEPGVTEVVTVRPLTFLWWPDVRDREHVRNAVFWAQRIFDIRQFNEIGFARVPEAFDAVCEQHELDGIYIEAEDSGHTAIMVCDPDALRVA